MIKHPREMKFSHLLPTIPTALLSSTVFGFIVSTVVLFCALNWDSAVFDGLNSFQKFINALFMATNARHAGENSINCSLMSQAVLVLFIVMM